jgi:hypothetical protein
MARGASKRPRNKDLEEALRNIPSDRPGLPARDSIVGVERFVSPQNEEYQILKTTEVDAYDEPPSPPSPPTSKKPKTPKAPKTPRRSRKS